MNKPFWRVHPEARFATLIRVSRNYCHPEAYEGAYESLKRLARRDDKDEMRVFKAELGQALENPADIPADELYEAVQYDDGSDEAFLRRLWRDLYPDEPVPERR
jgi:hypothetical protein